MTANTNNISPQMTGASLDKDGVIKSLIIWYAAFLAIIIVIAICASHGTTSPRIANPDIIGAPRPVPIWIDGINWVKACEIGTLIMMLVGLIAFTREWLKTPAHPTLLMVIAGTAIVWQDPWVNWAPYAVYNPELWHWPIDWPWISLSPTVEPFIVIGYASFYVGPYFPAIKILRKMQARAEPDAFVWRHPLISLGALAFVIGFIIDALLEISLVSNHLYIYSQVPAWTAVFAGQTHQFPILWESVMVTLVMVPAAVMLYRDDTGRTQAEKLSQRLPLFKKSPAWANFIVMFGILNVAYFAYGGAFWIMKVGHFADTVACPWPYPEAKVYDPQGYYEASGQVGPYFEGKWATWASGVPEGRPNVKFNSSPNPYCRSNQ